MAETQAPAYGMVAERILQITPDAHIARVIPFPQSGTFVFQIEAGDRKCEVEFSDEFLEDLRDYDGSKTAKYWQEMERALTAKVVTPMERFGVIPYTKETLKKAIFEHVKAESQRGGQVNKFNLVGRPYQRGSLEGFLKVTFREDERHSAALAFDELRSQGLLVPTYTDLINPEDWVKAGKELAAESADARPVEPEQQTVQVAVLEKIGEIPVGEVFLSSTVENLRDCRAEIVSELQRRQIRVVYAESPDFAGIPPENRYDICLVRVQAATMFVIIADRTYGEFYQGENHPHLQKVSITHAELKTAMSDKRNKPVLFYVRDNVWQEYQLWKKNPKLKCDTDHRVFEMIREYDGAQKWIEPFGDSVELKQKLLRRLQLT